MHEKRIIQLLASIVILAGSILPTQAANTDKVIPPVLSLLLFNGGGSEPCAVEPGQTSAASYTISWDAISDPLTVGLTGFKVYYGTAANLSTSNAAGSFDVMGDVTSGQFIPNDYAYVTCDAVHLGVTSIGSLDDSLLSNIVQVIVE